MNSSNNYQIDYPFGNSNSSPSDDA